MWEQVRQEKFQLDTEICAEYPGLESLPADVQSSISSIYKNIRTVERYLEKVVDGKPTGSVESHLLAVRKTLNFLKKEAKKFSPPPPEIFDKFITDHKAKLAEISKKAKEIIGDKKRDPQIDSIYR